MVAVDLPIVDYEFPCLAGGLTMGPIVDLQRDLLGSCVYTTFGDLQWTWTPHYCYLKSHKVPVFVGEALCNLPKSRKIP